MYASHPVTFFITLVASSLPSLVTVVEIVIHAFVIFRFIIATLFLVYGLIIVLFNSSRSILLVFYSMATTSRTSHQPFCHTCRSVYNFYYLIFSRLLPFRVASFFVFLYPRSFYLYDYSWSESWCLRWIKFCNSVFFIVLRTRT